MARYNRTTDPFLYEFLKHLGRRDAELRKIMQSCPSEYRGASAFIALNENRVLEQYFTHTLQQSGLMLSRELVSSLEEMTSAGEQRYVSRAGPSIITSYSVSTVWTALTLTLIAVWTAGRTWMRKFRD